MKKSAFVSSTLCLALSLTACGGSGDDKNTSTITNPTTPTNPTNPTKPTTPTNSNAPIQNGEFNYSMFEFYFDAANKLTLWRFDDTIRTGSITEVISRVIGTSKYEDDISPDNMEYRVGKNFISAMPANNALPTIGQNLKIIDNNTFQVSYPSTPLVETYNISNFDISGLGRNSTNYQKGIFTELDFESDSFKSVNYSYPQGSQCYVLNTKTNMPTYYFFYSDLDSSSTLQDWLADEQKYNIEINGTTQLVKASEITYENVGKNNELPAVHFKDQLGNYHAAVLYQGEVYDAEYNDGVNYDKSVNNPNSDVTKCWSYNKVAADYLAEQIKASYGK